MAALFAFILSPLGRYAMIGIAAVAIFGYGYHKGGQSARAACEEKAHQAQVAADKQDKAAGDQQRQQEVQVDAELKALTDRQAARIKELETNAKAISPTCVYPMPDPRKQPVGSGVRARPAEPRAGN